MYCTYKTVCILKVQNKACRKYVELILFWTKPKIRTITTNAAKQCYFCTFPNKKFDIWRFPRKFGKSKQNKIWTCTIP